MIESVDDHVDVSTIEGLVFADAVGVVASVDDHVDDSIVGFSQDAVLLLLSWVLEWLVVCRLTIADVVFASVARVFVSSSPVCQEITPDT